MAAPPQDKLDAITLAVSQMRHLQDLSAQLTADLATVTTEARRIAEQVLPALMDEAGLASLRLDDGATLTREDAVYASIAQADAADAAAWLVQNGYGAIVKAAFQIPVGKGDTKLQVRIRTLLGRAKVDYEETSSVHPQTLRAFARESVAEGRNLPASIKVHIQPTVKLAVPKVR